MATSKKISHLLLESVLMKHIALTLLSSLSLLSCHADEKQASSAKEISADKISAENIATLATLGFTPLLNENSSEGWKVLGNQNATFTVKDGVVTGKGTDLKRNSFLCSDKRYRNFVFAFEMKFDHLKGNSGCMFRANTKENGRVFGYQCEHDNTKRSWTAGIYDEARRGWIAPVKKDKSEEAAAARKAFTEQGLKIFKTDDWNTIVIQCQGDHIKIWLNGEVRVDYTDTDEKNKTAEGFFGLQVHSGKSCDVRWRNIFVKELP